MNGDDEEQSVVGPVPAEKIPYEIVLENMALEVLEGEQVAFGWQAWAAGEDGFEPPEFGPWELDGRRVQGIFAEHRYDAVLIQRAYVEPGLQVSFSMDFRVEPGEHGYERERPAGMVVGVGLDPSGNDDPRAETVVWALRDLPYLQTVRASVTAVAPLDLVTVFVRSVAFIPGSGTAAGNGAAQVCSTRLCARESYCRTYLLLPPQASQLTWENAARVAFARKWTVGGSADDAGMASALLTQQNTRVIAIDPATWGNGGLTPGWYQNNYAPGVTYVQASSAQLGNVANFLAFIDGQLPNC
jgi:hypothetical protein